MTLQKEVEFISFDGLRLGGTFVPSMPSQRARASAVLVHGITASREEWGFFTRLAPLMSGWGISTLRFDYRCHGSARSLPMTELSLTGISNDLDAAVRTLRESTADERGRLPLIAVAVSFGGGVTAEWACRHRDEVALLVLCSPVLDYEADIDKAAGDWRSQLRETNFVHYGEQRLNRALANEAARYDGILARSNWPTTVILHGDADIDVPIDRSRRAAATLGLKLIEVPGADHGFVVPGDLDAATPGTLAHYQFVFDRLGTEINEKLERLKRR